MGDLLVVTSKVKQYIREKSQMNTASNLISVLSEKIKGLCDQAIQHAQAEGRKTVMDRDLSTTSEPSSQ